MHCCGVTIHVWPDDQDVALGEVKAFAGARSTLHYTGRDEQIVRTFANENTCLLQIAQATASAGSPAVRCDDSGSAVSPGCSIGYYAVSWLKRKSRINEIRNHFL
jgi:hypothetical protein